jgi:mannose-6-phosphate isomerase
MHQLEGSVKHYAWGGFDYISRLFDIENKDRHPLAEIWFGTHPGGPAMSASGQPLLNLLSDELPYLVKILDVNDMLSIQTHPSLEQAKRGFESEEIEGISKDSPARTYKDKNHKPELMVALSEFYLLQGFRPAEALRKTLQDMPSFRPLLPFFEQGGLKALYTRIMTMDQEDINRILKPLGQQIKPQFEQDQFTKADANYWAAKAFLRFNRKGFCDRGIISIYLMNLIKLNVGEGIFQAPGVLHAYLQGQNLECMACSDNVLRGGLTQKHINIKGLLETVVYEHGHSEIILPKNVGKGYYNYNTPASEFAVYQVTQASENQVLPLLSENKMVVLLKGNTMVDTGSGSQSLSAANVYFFSGEEALRFYEISQDIKLFIATLPDVAIH